MKKTLILSAIFMLVLGITVNVFAAEGTVAILDAKADKETVVAGEELVLTLTLKDISASQGTGITSLTTQIDYDTNIFETITEENIQTITGEDSNSVLFPIYNDNEGTHELTLATNTGIKTDRAIAKITFKAKQNVTSTTTSIEFKNSTIKEGESQAVSIENSKVEVKVGIEEIPTIALSKIEITKEPTKKVYKTGEKFDKTGMEVKATYSDNTTKIITDYTYEPTAELKDTDKTVTITYKEGTITKTAVQEIIVNETGTLPDTGAESFAIAILAILSLVVISYIKARKYSNI